MPVGKTTLPLGGDLDPHDVDLAAPRPRARRDRPDPPDELQAWAVDAQARLMKRPYPPNAILEPAGLDREHFTAPHNDESLWTLQLADAFGTRSRAVLNTFVNQLHALCAGKVWDEDAKQWRIDESEFSSMLALVNSLRPKDEAQAMLAAQMVAVHLLNMKVAERAIRWPSDSIAIANVARLSRAFALQVEAMQSLKGRRASRQSIKVKKETSHHQHIHLHQGGGNSKDQPHERTGQATAQTYDQRPIVRGNQPGGIALSLPGDEGAPTLRAPRRKEPGGAQG